MRFSPANTLRQFLNTLGIDVYRIKKETIAGLTYERISPPATFAPWNMDAAFQKTYNAVKDNTFVDIYRCYELWTLVEQSSKASAGALIEIGTWRGGSGAIIASQAENLGITEPVYLCDTFSGVVKASAHDVTFYKGGEHADTSAEIVERLVSKQLGLTNTVILKGVFPDETAHKITSEKFRFCHIDVDTYQSAKDIVDWIWKKMSLFGIIVFDDYGFKYCEGITTYVEELRHQPNSLLINSLSGHAILIKTHE